MAAHKFLVAIAAISLATGSSAGPCIPQSSVTTETVTTSGTETSLTASSSTGVVSSTETIISSTTEALSSTETVTSFTTETPSTTVAPTSTTTIEEEIVITMAKRSFQDGPPLRKNVHCEVNGSRKEIVSLDQFDEERPGVPISIESCFQKCKGRANTEPTCKSFSFSYGGHGQPLCNLFDESVSGSVSTLDHAEVSLWFDLVCGSPSEKGWEPSDM